MLSVQKVMYHVQDFSGVFDVPNAGLTQYFLKTFFKLLCSTWNIGNFYIFNIAAVYIYI